MSDGDGMSDIDRDAILLARFAAGDQAATRELTDALLPGVLRQAFRILGDHAEAEDIAQDALMRLWKQAENWRAGEARASTWIYRVVHNLCIDRIRKRRPQVPVEDAPEPVDPDPSVLQRMAETETSEAIARAIGTLPERQRQALILRHFEEWSNPDIAAQLECSVEAVESLLSRARRQLAKIMKDERKALDDD
ncbi:MAG: RNA polymerase sigma factor [Pseudomonadota bacterium]